MPLVIAATLALVRAWDRRGAGAFALAGAAFGLAALCRSMPIYFVAAAAVAVVLRDWPRQPGEPRHRRRQPDRARRWRSSAASRR